MTTLTLNGLDLDMLLAMGHGQIDNYVIPGLSSTLIAQDDKACVRMLYCGRNHTETVVPHSHRYDFQAMVLRGSVVNTLWEQDDHGDAYTRSNMTFVGVGNYERTAAFSPALWRGTPTTLTAGDCYRMTHDQIHSITFTRGTLVLMFEGPSVTSITQVLEPRAGEMIHTLKVEPWTFKGADK